MPRYRLLPRCLGLWLGVRRLASLDVPTEAKAHRGEYLFSKGVFLPRAESSIERRGKHIRGNRFLERLYELGKRANGFGTVLSPAPRATPTANA